MHTGIQCAPTRQHECSYCALVVKLFDLQNTPDANVLKKHPLITRFKSVSGPFPHFLASSALSLSILLRPSVTLDRQPAFG